MIGIPIKRNKHNTKGETLAETIIALSILAIGITVASTVILNSIRNLTNAKNRVIAINLAREGIEAMRSIRDTNWLFYSDRRRQCWNHHPSVTAGCDGTTPMLPGVYVIHKHTNQSWRIQQADEDPNIDSDLDGTTDNDLDLTGLSLVDIDNSFDSDGDGDPTNDFDLYNHKHSNVVNSLGAEVRGSPFTRYLVVEYLENTPDPLSAPANLAPPNDSVNTLAEWNDATNNQTALNRMRLTSVVGWQRGGAVHTAEVKTIITDHLGRQSLTQ